MPTFLSVRSRHQIELRRGYFGKVKDPILGEMDTVVKPMKVTFVEMHAPFVVPGLPGKNGVARGILTPEEGARQIRAQSQEVGPAGENLPEDDGKLADWLVKKLRKHPGNGSHFIEVADSAEEAVPEFERKRAQEEDDGDPVGEAFRTGVFKSMPDKNTYCSVCNETKDNRGLIGHLRAKKHLENLANREFEARKASGF